MSEQILHISYRRRPDICHTKTIALAIAPSLYCLCSRSNLQSIDKCERKPGPSPEKKNPMTAEGRPDILSKFYRHVP